MGANQKSQSCEIAQPPTKRATPVLLAGLTDVLVTGMLMRCIRVRPKPMAIGAKSLGSSPVRRKNLLHHSTRLKSINPSVTSTDISSTVI